MFSNATKKSIEQEKSMSGRVYSTARGHTLPLALPHAKLYALRSKQDVSSVDCSIKVSARRVNATKKSIEQEKSMSGRTKRADASPHLHLIHFLPRFPWQKILLTLPACPIGHAQQSEKGVYGGKPVPPNTFSIIFPAACTWEKYPDPSALGAFTSAHTGGGGSKRGALRPL